MLRTAAAIAATLTLASCAVFAPIEPGMRIEGRDVTSTVIVVNQKFDGRPPAYTVHFPAGEYRPAFQDQSGVYFKSVNQVTATTIIGGRTFVGGLYVAKTSWSDMRFYVDEGSVYRFNLSGPIDHSVVTSPKTQ